MLARGIDEEHILPVVHWFGLAEHEDAGSEAGAVEEVWAKSDYGF